MIKREAYLAKIKPFIGKDIIKVLTGLRRSGKSALLEQIRGSIASPNTIFLNFEDLDNAHLCTASALHTYVSDRIGPSSDPYYLFFDEIQEVDGWEKAVNSLRVRHNVDIYLTGSNSRLLSGELATYIAGRYITLTVYPFSYAEFRLSGGSSFEDYLRCGGMPFLASLSFAPGPAHDYLKDVFNSVVLKDIVQRRAIRNVDLLRRILAFAMDNIGRRFSANSICAFLRSERRNVAPETVLNYLQACEEAYLLIGCKEEDIQGKRILQVNDKYYVADHGLREAVAGSNLRDEEIVLENIVCLELLRRGWDVRIGRVGDLEVDFIARKDGEKAYFQITYALRSEKTIEREFAPLLAIRDNYPKYVLYREGTLRGNYQGIPVMPIDDWLLTEEPEPSLLHGS